MRKAKLPSYIRPDDAAAAWVFVRLLADTETAPPGAGTVECAKAAGRLDHIVDQAKRLVAQHPPLPADAVRIHG